MDLSWVQPLLDAVEKGADPRKVVPDGLIIVRGGVADVPATGVPFSGALGRTIREAGAGVPHNKFRVTTAGEIRAQGGIVEFAPEVDPRTGRLNVFHVNVTEGGPTCFSEPVPNPTPKTERLR